MCRRYTLEVTSTNTRTHAVNVGLALGSGSARGWSHIGVLGALRARGIEPTIVTGASTGSLVAASYASDQLEALETWARQLTKIDVWRLLDATFTGGGVIRGNRVMRAVGERLEDFAIESLSRQFGAVAVDLYTGREVWLRTGSMLDAVRASSGLPGLFTPTLHEGRWLIDGGVLNPVPVSLCRALGADYVIAVNLNRRSGSRKAQQTQAETTPDRESKSASDEGIELFARWSGLLENFVSSIRTDRQPSEPGMIEVVYNAIIIMQDQIARSRMLGDPPDLIVTPDLGDFQMMDFHRAAEAIEAGHAAVEKVSSELPDGD